MAKIAYWVVYGTIRQNGTPQASADVTIRNETRSEEKTVQTDANGKYSITVTREDWFPSGCYEDDTIKVTYSTQTAQFVVNITTHPSGRKVSLDFYAMTETAEGTPTTLLAVKNVVLTDITEATHSVSTVKIIGLQQIVEALHQLSLPFKLLSLTETTEGTPSLKLPLRLLAFSEIVEGLCGSGQLTIYGVGFFQFTQTVTGTPKVTTATECLFENILEATHVFKTPVHPVIQSESIEAVHQLKQLRLLFFQNIVEGTPSLLSSPRLLSLTENIEGIPIIAAALKSVLFIEIIEGVPNISFVGPGYQLIQFADCLEATHELGRHKTLFLTEPVEGIPLTSLALKLVSLTGYVEGLPDLKLPQRPALLLEILIGLPTVSAEFLEPEPFTTRLYIRGRNLDLRTKSRELNLSVKKRKLILTIRGERD